MPSILEKIVAKRKIQVEETRRARPESLLKEMLETRTPIRDFAVCLHKNADKPAAVIAEIKRRSPSKGDLKPDLDPAKLASDYEKGQAVALSILTEPDFFAGSPEDLMAARSVTSLPVLRKDFIFSAYQVLESAAMGADAILLIARILDPYLHRDLAAMAGELGIGVLHEIHGEEEIFQVLEAKARLVGINNRDLSSFQTDIALAPRLAALLPEDVIPVALSGIRGPEDVAVSRRKGIHSFLVGESLVRSEDPAHDLRAMVQTS